MNQVVKTLQQENGSVIRSMKPTRFQQLNILSGESTVDIQASRSPLVMRHKSRRPHRKSAKVKGSKNRSSSQCFRGRDVKHQAAASSQGQMPPPSEQTSQIPARKTPRPPALLLSPKELADEIRLEIKRELKACETLPVFYVGVGCEVARLTKAAKQRMYDDGLSTDDVKNAIQLTSGKCGLNQASQHLFDRFYFVANHKVIDHLRAFAYDDLSSQSVFKPGIDVFECFCEIKKRWVPALARRSLRNFPEPLVDRRYLSIKDDMCIEGNEDEMSVTVDREKYLADKVAECLTGTLSVFCHTLHSSQTDREKVTFLRNLINMETSVSSTKDDSMECGIVAKEKRLSATEYLAQIRYAQEDCECRCDNSTR